MRIYVFDGKNVIVMLVTVDLAKEEILYILRSPKIVLWPLVAIALKRVNVL